MSLWSALGMFLLAGHREEKWNSASGLHEPVARGGDDGGRRDPGSESRAAAANSDDHASIIAD
jgi:hypothetical protein